MVNRVGTSSSMPSSVFLKKKPTRYADPLLTAGCTRVKNSQQENRKGRRYTNDCSNLEFFKINPHTCVSPKPRRSSDKRVSRPSSSTANTTVSAARLAKGKIDCGQSIVHKTNSDHLYTRDRSQCTNFCYLEDFKCYQRTIVKERPTSSSPPMVDIKGGNKVDRWTFKPGPATSAMLPGHGHYKLCKPRSRNFITHYDISTF